MNITCLCPASRQISFRGERPDDNGNPKAHFEGRLLQCRHCDINKKFVHNTEAARHRKGAGRQVYFLLEDKRRPNYTDWMKHRVDSARGKTIYNHRMSVVEPVLGNITTNKKLNRFSLHGERKVKGKRKLYCMLHNIEKLMNYGTRAA